MSRLLRMRSHVILASAAGFLVWQGGWLLADLLAPGPAATASGVASGVGGVAWVLATIALLVYFERVRRARAGDALNDELARHNQTRAFVAGYWTVAGSIALLLGLAGFVELEPNVIVRGLLILAVIVPLAVFVWVDRESEEEAS